MASEVENDQTMAPEVEKHQTDSEEESTASTERREVDASFGGLTIHPRTTSPKRPKTSVKKRGRPIGSKNRSKKSLENDTPKPQAKLGRPKGSRNKKGRKQKPIAKVDYAQQYMGASGASAGQGNILDLLRLFDKVIQTHWTDERILEYFGKKMSKDDIDAFENACHFYSSSKGSLICDNHTLPACKLFPGIVLSKEFLFRYLHTYDDALSYGDYVSQTRKKLETRARELEG